MFRYADSIDVILMIVGTLGSILVGIVNPVLAILNGNIVDKIG